MGLSKFQDIESVSLASEEVMSSKKLMKILEVFALANLHSERILFCI